MQQQLPKQELPDPPERLGVLPWVAVGLGVLGLLGFGPTLLDHPAFLLASTFAIILGLWARTSGRKMALWGVGLGVLAVLGAVSSTSPSANMDSEACVNRAELEASSDRASQTVADMKEAFAARDRAAFVSHSRDSADAFRAMAEDVAADPDVAQALNQAAALLDEAIDAVEQGKGADVSQRMTDAAEAFQRAMTAMDASTAVEC
jgi:hypothetical protein